MPFDIWRDDNVINPQTTGTQSAPQITQLANGNILVVWQTPRTATSTSDTTIAHIYDPLGNLISDEIYLRGVDSEGRPNPTFEGDVAAIPSGGFISAVLPGSTAELNGAVRLTTYDDDGNVIFARDITAFFTGATVNGPPTNTQLKVVVASDSSALITYVQEADNGSLDIIGRIYDISTRSVSPPIILVSEPGDIWNYDTVVLENGNYVMTSHTSVDDIRGIYMRIVDSDGNNVLSTTEVGTTVSGPDSDYRPLLAALADGNFVVAWSNLDATDTDIVLQIYDEAGNPIGAEQNATFGANSEVFPQEIVALDDGGFILIYLDSEGLGNTTYIQEYSATAARVGQRQEFLGSATNAEGILLEDGRVAVTYERGNDIGMVILDPRDGHEQTGIYDGDYIIGTIGNDIITESSSNLHFGWDGNDAIFAQSGTTIGTDEYDGGNGIDTINFNGSTESLAIFNLSSGIVTTSDGVDHVMANFENIVGTAQSDIIMLTTGNNKAYAGDGNDQITTLGGVDQIYGDAGIDTIFINGISPTGGSFFDGGSDNDTFDFSNLGSNYTANLTTVTFSGASTSFIINFENVVGGGGDDVITGDMNANVLSGGAGDDTIETVGGLDVLQGGAGNDTLLISAFGGGDYYSGGLGVDTLSFTGLQSDHVANLTTNIFSAIFGTSANSLDSIENVIGGNGADSIIGNLNDNILVGGGGDDTIETVGGLDVLQGGTGNDTLIASAVTLSGGTSFEGGMGTDTFSFSGLQSSYIANLTTGVFSRLNGSAPNALASIENVIGGNGGDNIIGNLSDNVLMGGRGNDTLIGGGGSDTIDGGAGDDTIYADAEDMFASLTGGADTDTLFLITEVQLLYDFAAQGFEFATVSNAAGSTLQTFTTLANSDTTLETFDVSDDFDWGRQVVRTDVSAMQNYTTLTLFYLDTTDALDTSIAELDNGNRITTNYDAADIEDFGLSIFTEDANNDELFTSVLQLRDDAGAVTRFVNTYDSALEVTVDFVFSIIGPEAEGLFDIVDNASWNRKVTNVDNSADGSLLNYQIAETYQNTALQNYGSDVLMDTGERRITDNDLDGSEGWAVQITRTDDADAFSWGTIVDQRDANGNTLYVSQTNDGSYDTIEVFDIAGAEIWNRTVTFVDDEDDFSWDTLTFFYDDMGMVYDTIEIPDVM